MKDHEHAAEANKLAILADAWEHAPQAQCLCYGSGQILLANRHARSLLGLPADSTEVRTIQQLFDIQLPQAIVTTQTIYSGDFVLELTPVNGSLIIEIRTRVEDIVTQLGLLEERLIKNIRHIIGTTTASIKTRLYLLSHQPDQVDTHSGVIQSSLGPLQRLSNDLDLVSSVRIQSEHGFRMNMHDPDNLVTQVIGPLTGKLTDTDHLTIDFAEKKITILGDENFLHIAIQAIIDNALEHVPDETQREIRISITQEDHMCVISVTDNGVGIRSEILPHIFDKYFVGDPSNHNMRLEVGLSLAYIIVQMHGGHITVDSQVGEGSTFRIHLPIVE